MKYFVHVSDTSAVCGNDPIYYGAENTIMIPKKHVLEAYGHSKYESELRAAKSNGCLLKNGKFSYLFFFSLMKQNDLTNFSTVAPPPSSLIIFV